MADTLLLKNTGSGVLSINDLGIMLNAGEQIDLQNLQVEEIVESTDLPVAFQSGDVEAKLNSTTVMSYQDVIDYYTSLTRFTKLTYSYISTKDGTTSISGAELERLRDGSDASASTALHSHDTRYYTKVNLQTSGQAAVSWDNITGAPAFGSLNWKNPVDRTDNSYGSGVSLPITGNAIDDARMVKDDGDGKPAQYVCVAASGTWSDQWKKIADVDWGNASGIGITPSGNLTSNNVQSGLYELQGDIDDVVDGTTDINLSLNRAYTHGSVITVNSSDVLWQMAAGRTFKMQTAVGAADILSVATGTPNSVAITGNLTVSGGGLSLGATAASNITVTGANLSVSTVTSGNLSLSSAGSLSFKDQYLSAPIPLSQSGTSGLNPNLSSTSIIGAINELWTTGGTVDTLDQSYDGPSGSGSGRVVTVEAGAVKLDSTSGAYAPLELTSRSSAPSASLAAGQIAVIGNELCVYDGGRSKWLSAATIPLSFSDSVAHGKYMQVGNANAIETGYILAYNATLTSVTAVAASGNLSKGFEIRRNADPTALKAFTLGTGGAYSSANDNVNLDAGDFLQAYCVGGGQPAKDVIVTALLKWRK